MKTCKDCPSTDLLPRGNGFRNRCPACQAAYQRECYRNNREQYVATRKKLYRKHVVKRIAEASHNKLENRTRYSVLEWFRRQGIAAADIEPDQLNARVEMKESKDAANRTEQTRQLL